MYYIEGQMNPLVGKGGSGLTIVGMLWPTAIVFPIYWQGYRDAAGSGTLPTGAAAERPESCFPVFP